MLQIFDELDGESTSDDSGLPDIPSGDEGEVVPVIYENVMEPPSSPSIFGDQENRDEPVEDLCDSDASTILYISDSSSESESKKRARSPDISVPGPSQKKRRFTVSIFN